MALVQGLGKFSGIAHIFMHHPIAQFASREPIIGGTQQPELLGSIQVVNTGPQRLRQAAQKFREKLVGQGVLKAPKSRNECISALGFIHVDTQFSCSRRIEWALEKPPVGLAQMFSFKGNCLHQENQSRQVAHKTTPSRIAAR